MVKEVSQITMTCRTRSLNLIDQIHDEKRRWNCLIDLLICILAMPTAIPDVSMG